MQLTVGTNDLSKITETVTWSGDISSVARKLEFTIAKNTLDPAFPAVVINTGDKAALCDDAGNVVFWGVIFDISRTASTNTVKYTAYDLLFYVNKSELSKDYAGTPEQIAADVCAELGITPGNLAVTGIAINNPCIKKTGYVVIQSSYTAAARINGKKYMPLIQEINKLSVIEKGTDCGARITATANASDAEYSESLQNMVNRVLITDKNGNTISTVEDGESRNQYGTIQKILQQEKGKDATAEARNMLNNGEASATVSALDDVRAVTGYSLLIEEPDTKLVGKFYIESDSHTYENGKATMKLSLTFENLMDEQEPGEPEEDDKKKGK